MSFDDVITEASAPAAAPASRRGGGRVDIGGTPQVSLLPPEIRTAGRSRNVRLAMVGVVAAAALVACAMTALASGAAATAQARVDAETARTQQLSLQVGKFNEVQRLDQNVRTSRAAVKVATSTRIDWKTQIEAIQAEMPPDYIVKSITADSATPIVDYAQGTGPLDQPRMATVTLAVDAPTINRLPYWLRMLRSMPAYADQNSSVDSRDEATGLYHVTVVLHLGSKAKDTSDGDD